MSQSCCRIECYVIWKIYLNLKHKFHRPKAENQISCCMCVLSITGLVHGDCGQPLPQTRQNKCNWGSTVVVDMLYGTSLYTIYCRYITVNVTRYWTRFDSVKDRISFRPSTDKRHLIRRPYVRAMGRLLSVLWIYYAARYAEYTVLSRD